MTHQRHPAYASQQTLEDSIVNLAMLARLGLGEADQAITPWGHLLTHHVDALRSAFEAHCQAHPLPAMTDAEPSQEPTP